MSNKVSYVTKEGLKKLQEELERLQNVERPKISKAIGEAIEKGKGVALKDNKFIGPPMVKMAKEILRKQGLIESRKNLRLNSSSCC